MTARQNKSKSGRRRPASDVDVRTLKALGHPVRARALAILNRRIASPKAIAIELGLPLGAVAHHIKQLEDLGLIELVGAEPRRGATEHFYKGLPASFLADEYLEQQGLQPEARSALTIDRVKAVFESVRGALVSGTFDCRADRHLSQIRVRIDDEGWRDLMELLRNTQARAEEIESEAIARTAHAQELTRDVDGTVALFGFESPTPSSEHLHPNCDSAA